MAATQLAHPGLQSAIEFATKAHAGQFRKGSGLPYIVHPFAVLSLIGEWGWCDPEVWKAAICHDVKEDCPALASTMMLELGPVVDFLVDELTFTPSGNEPIKVQKRRYMDSFAKKCISALVIKVADRCCNTRDFLQDEPEYASIYWKKANTLFDSMLARRSEIVETCGESVFARMKHTVDTISHECLAAKV